MNGRRTSKDSRKIRENKGGKNKIPEKKKTSKGERNTPGNAGKAKKEARNGLNF